jgi:Arc/MetJ-type ribon-helix-helix transcriptional regulator
MSKPLKNEWIRFRVTPRFKTAVERHIVGKYKNISDYIRKLIEQDLMNNTNSENDNLRVLLRKAVEKLKEGEP